MDVHTIWGNTMTSGPSQHDSDTLMHDVLSRLSNIEGKLTDLNGTVGEIKKSVTSLESDMSLITEFREDQIELNTKFKAASQKLDEYIGSSRERAQRRITYLIGLLSAVILALNVILTFIVH